MEISVPVPLMRVRPAARRLSRYVTTPHILLAFLFIAMMFYLIVFPLGRMIWTASTWQMGDERLARGIDVQEGAFTLFHWQRVFASKVTKAMLIAPLRNTFVTALGATLLALSIGSILAWLVSRTDLPLRRFITSVVTIPYMLPSWVLALSWIIIFKNQRIGGAKGLLEYVTGLQVPDWLAYGPVPIVVALSLHYYAFAFLLLSGALVSLDSSLEESAELFGASRWRILRKITLPLMMPAFLSAFILTFSRTLGTFGTPAFLGRPVRYFTLSTMIYSNVKQGLYADGFVLALLLIVLSAVTIYVNQGLIGTRKGFHTIAGKGFRGRPTPLRGWKVPILALVLVFLALCVFLPVGVLFYRSFMLFEGNYSLSNLSLHYWIGDSDPRIAEGSVGLLRDPMILKTAWNSIRLSVLTAIITAVIGILLGYAIVKGRGTRLSRLVEQMAFLPYLMPSIAFGAIYISMFAKPLGPIPALYDGTFTILVVISVVKHLPYSSRAGVGSVMQVAGELEEAATVAGAKWVRRFRKIILPLSSSGLMAGTLLT
ncbi:MAG: ABC transporter permease subunit, partial [Anaerolineae bacterium]|nr:ABC transporter permease subunit [Anaerolineae bacterium]NIN97669.1 ABC transporter permease subunit [Anaerolineae bacterium]